MAQIRETADFIKWLNMLNSKEQGQIVARLERIKSHDHFGDVKNLGKGLCELRWKNGWRVYFMVSTKSIILIIGGHKNEQEKNIKKARLFVGRHTQI